MKAAVCCLVLCVVVGVLGSTSAAVVADNPILQGVKLMKAGHDNAIYVVSTSNNVDVFYKISNGEILQTVQFPEDAQVIALAGDTQGNVYFFLPLTPDGAYGLGVLRKDSQNVVSLYDGQVFSSFEYCTVFTDKEDTVFFLDGDSAKVVQSDNIIVPIRNVGRALLGAIEDSKGNLYLAQNYGTQVSYLGVLEAEQKQAENPEAWTVNAVFGAAMELRILPDDTVVIASGTKVTKLDSKSNLAEIQFSGETQFLQVDGLGNVFVVTKEQDVSYAFQILPNNTIVGLDNLQGISRDFVGISVDSSNNVYFGTLESAAYLLEAGTTSASRLSGLPNGQRLYDLALGANDTLLLLAEALFTVQKGSQNAVEVATLPFGGKQLVLSENGNLYVNSQDGLFFIPY